MGEDRPDAALPGEQPGAGRTRTICVRRASVARSPRAPTSRTTAPHRPRCLRRSGPSSAARPAAPRCSLRCRASACPRPTGLPPPPVDERTARSFGPTTPGAGAEGFEAPLGSRILAHPPQGAVALVEAGRGARPVAGPGFALLAGASGDFHVRRLAAAIPRRRYRARRRRRSPKPEPAKTKEPRGAGRGRFGLSALLLTLISALLAGVVGGGAGWWLAERSNRVLTNGGVTLGTAGSPANRPPGSVADIAKRVSPAVVSIDVQGSGVTGTGSGFVIDRAATS